MRSTIAGYIKIVLGCCVVLVVHNTQATAARQRTEQWCWVCGAEHLIDDASSTSSSQISMHPIGTHLSFIDVSLRILRLRFILPHAQVLQTRSIFFW